MERREPLQQGKISRDHNTHKLECWAHKKRFMSFKVSFFNPIHF